MKFLKMFFIALAAALGAMSFTASHAVAAAPYWQRTQVEYYSDRVTIYWCSGGTGILYPRQYTGTNVCGVRLPNDRVVYVYEKDTGKVLLDRKNCSGSTQRINITTSSDTGGTAILYYGGMPGCN